MKLTSSQEALLRTQPHRTNLWMSFYRPRTLMSARVTGSFVGGETQIGYSDVGTGSYTNLYPDLTVLVGSQPNEDDYGRIRLRSATGTYIITAENAINWNTGQYLTFIHQIDIQAIYPKIIPDPNNAENVIFYKDNDIPYSNQNSIYGTFPNAGPHRAGFLDAGTGTFFFSATGTYNVNGDNLTYSWNFENGTPTGSTAHTPGNVRWSQPGHNVVRLRVTSSSGAVDDTYRYVSLYNRPYQGTNVPTLKWEVSSPLSGSRGEGGYTMSFKVYENFGDVQPNAVVVIFADTWYGGTKINLGGNALNNSSIVFVGYIIGDSIRFDYQKSYVEFSVGSVTEMMKNAEGFSVSCESKAVPSTWFELKEMTVQKAIYHYLRWHSTVLKVTDFQYLNDDLLVQYFDSDRGSLYAAVDSFLRDGLLGSLVADRQGKLWGEIDSYGQQEPFTTIPNNFTVHKQDWIGQPSIQERRNSETSFIELGGIAFYGVSSNTFSALLTNAPSVSPLYHGKSSPPHEGLILVSQMQLNQISGNYLAYENTEFPNIDMTLAGFYANLDIAPQERLFLVIDQNDSVRNRSIQNLPYIINSMEWNYDSKNESFIPQITLNQIATGTAGQTVVIPATPPYQNSGFDFPALQLPSTPIYTPTTTPSSLARFIAHNPTYGLLYAEDFDSTYPHWRTVNGGLTAQQYQDINEVLVTPNGAIYVAYRISQGTADPARAFIARAPYIGGTFTVLEDLTSILAKFPGSTFIAVSGLAHNPAYPEQVMYVVSGDMGGFPTAHQSKTYIGAGSSFSLGTTFAWSMVGFAYSALCSLSFGLGKWLLTGLKSVPEYWIFNAAGTAVELNGTVAGNNPFHFRASDTGRTFHVGGTSASTYYYSDDNGRTYTLLGPNGFTPSLNGTNYYDCDPTGMFLMGQGQGGAGKVRSSDSGATFLPIPTLPPGGYRYTYCGGDGVKSTWAAAVGVLRYTPDWGATWINKEGNMLSLTPFISINLIKAVGV